MTLQSEFDIQRERMINDQVKGRGISDARVLAALRAVPRHLFVPEQLQSLAYEDGPLPIGSSQTISQPYIVALMTQMLELRPHDVVLEIGTGSGYQTAILCEIAKYVYSLERHAALANHASALLDDLGYEIVVVLTGDGSLGLPEMAPFNAIIVTAAAPAIPGPLRAQMAPGGRMVVPTGERHQQQLQRVRRSGDSWKVESTIPVMFVPLYGQHGFTPPDVV